MLIHREVLINARVIETANPPLALSSMGAISRVVRVPLASHIRQLLVSFTYGLVALPVSSSAIAMPDSARRILP